MNPALLQNIARQTDGEFRLAGNAGGLADALDKRQRGTNVLMRHELWDMPIIFLLMVLFLGAEWSYRRWRKLV